MRTVTFAVVVATPAHPRAGLGSTTFGFLGSWTGTNAVPAPITCGSP